MTDFQKLQLMARMYHELLADPHPGLSTWCEMFRDKTRELQKELTEWTDEWKDTT